MKIIRPAPFGDGDLTSNVAISETEWTAGTYTTGQQRYVGSDLYEVTAVPDTTDEPVAGTENDPPSWIKVGKINRWKMFSGIIAEKTTQEAGPIEVTVDPGGVVNAVAFFGVEASSVSVTVTDPTDGVVYSKTEAMVDNSAVTDWYQYFYAPILRKEEVVFLDLPSYGSATVSAEIDAGGSDTACGEMVIGLQRNIGVTLLEFTTGLRDFSRKEQNVFGGFEILERRFSRFAEFDVFVPKVAVSGLLRLLAERRALPTVYIGGENDPETIIYGFYTDQQVLRSAPQYSEMSITIEGLT